MKKTILLFTIALMLILALCGCSFEAEQPPEAAEPTPEATAVPTQTPPPFDEQAAAASLEQLIREALIFSAGQYLPENMFAEEAAWDIFGSAPEEREWLPRMQSDFEEALLQAIHSGQDKFNEERTDTSEHNSSYNIKAPTWQLMYALIKAAGSTQLADEVLASAMNIEVTLSHDEGIITTQINVAPKNYKEAFAAAEGITGEPSHASFAYSYALTVYDEEAMEKDYVQPEPQGSLAQGITWPLASHTNLRKTWYADRDGGSRKHTGTDIWAAADTELYSCTDGTVTFIGYNEGMGNAVIITDVYGYEFHYYHMIRLTDFLKEGDTVKAGDHIGNVGNTGNSALDHLHLTIVDPEGLYINPYPYLAEVEPG